MIQKLTLHDVLTRHTLTLKADTVRLDKDIILLFPDSGGRLITFEELSDVSTLPSEFVAACKGERGNSIVDMVFYSTTATNGQPNQPGATDTYRVTFTDKKILDIPLYNGYRTESLFTKEEVMAVVDKAITNLVGLAPEELNTLQELAKKLMDNEATDASNLLVLTNLIGEKAKSVDVTALAAALRGEMSTGDGNTLAAAKADATAKDTTLTATLRSEMAAGNTTTLNSAKADSTNKDNTLAATLRGEMSAGNTTTLNSAKSDATTKDNTVLSTLRSEMSAADTATLNAAKTDSTNKDTAIYNTLAQLIGEKASTADVNTHVYNLTNYINTRAKAAIVSTANPSGGVDGDVWYKV